MVKSGKPFVEIGPRLEIALFLFLFYRNFQPPPTAYSDLPTYLILPNVPTPLPPVYSGTKSM